MDSNVSRPCRIFQSDDVQNVRHLGQLMTGISRRNTAHIASVSPMFVASTQDSRIIAVSLNMRYCAIVNAAEMFTLDDVLQLHDNPLSAQMHSPGAIVMVSSDVTGTERNAYTGSETGQGELVGL